MDGDDASMGASDADLPPGLVWRQAQGSFQNWMGSPAGHADERLAVEAPAPKRAANGKCDERQLPKSGFIANAEMVKLVLPGWCSMTNCLPQKTQPNCLHDLQGQAEEVGGFLRWRVKKGATGDKSRTWRDKRHIVTIVTTVGHAWPMWLLLRQVIVDAIVLGPGKRASEGDNVVIELSPRAPLIPGIATL